ncbi:hypothetical protein P7K49_019448 [Saguinus oedipus]|uniref:Uncharacterized protein n=1 Tax=Saguinus oedipus TaxID=9490 RepID=A0ABQ9UZX2_SAGOE|nr:hypothetical protein P7K49_019448 [Saguinus oedipus]
MAVDQDWASVYPVAAPFKPSAVPLPVRMGYPVKKGVPMAKEGNLELLKTQENGYAGAGDGTVKLLKTKTDHFEIYFCTDWPAALDSDEKCEKHFPIEIDTSDYVSSGLSVRNPKARVVVLRTLHSTCWLLRLSGGVLDVPCSLKIKLSSLNLDDHAKKKLIKLVGERYCKTTDMLTIKTDSIWRRQYRLGLMIRSGGKKEPDTHAEIATVYNKIKTVVRDKLQFRGNIELIHDVALRVNWVSDFLTLTLCRFNYHLALTQKDTKKGEVTGCVFSGADVSLPSSFETVYSSWDLFEGDFPVKTEEWEKRKTEADMEEYIWENSSSERNILETLLQIKAAEKNTEVNKEELLGTKEVEEYKKSVVSLKNEGENENSVSQYKESVKRLLHLT